MKSKGYSIKDLEILSGVKAHTIRIWEKRYNLLIPQRTETNIRYYTDEDLKRMLNISLLVRNGYKISKVAQWTEKKIKDIVIDISEKKTSQSDYIERLMLHMLNFDNLHFYKLTNEILANIEFEAAVFEIFFKLFERIGMYWQVGSIFPAQEHYVINIFRQKLIAEIDRLETEDAKRATILFFLPENELHEMSLLFYSYLAKKYGYNVIYLGQVVPFEDLKSMVRNTQIDFVFTAFINSNSKENIENYLVELKDIFQKQKIFITGLQLHLNSPQVPRNVKTVKDYREFLKFLG